MDFPESHYYNINRQLLRCFGQWPIDSTQKYTIRRVFFVLCQLLMILSMVAKLYTSNLDKDVILIDAPMINAMTAGIIAFFNIYKNAEKFKYLIQLIEKNWKEYHTEEERNIKRSFALFGKRVSIYTTLYASVMIPLHSIYTFSIMIYDKIVNDKSPNLDNAVIKLEIFTTNVVMVVLSTLYIYLAFSMSIFLTLAIVLMYLVHVEHSIGMFHVLGNRIENVFMIYEQQVNSNDYQLKNELTFRMLYLCVKSHQEAIEFTSVIKECISTPLFIGLMATLSNAIIILVLLSERIEIGIVMFFLGQMLLMYLTSVLGQQFVDNISIISERAWIKWPAFQTYRYNSMWYEAPMNFQKLILFFIIRSQKLIVLDSYQFIELTLESYRSVMSTGLSYFLVLKSLITKEK